MIVFEGFNLNFGNNVNNLVVYLIFLNDICMNMLKDVDMMSNSEMINVIKKDGMKY